MLYEIDSPPTPGNSLILLHPADSVAIARVPVPAGTVLNISGQTVTSRAALPGLSDRHSPIELRRSRLPVREHYWFRTAAIQVGDHVHVHNLGYEERNANEIRPESIPPRSTRSSTATFHWICTPGRPCRYAQLHRRCRCQQLRRSYIRINRSEFCV